MDKRRQVDENDAEAWGRKGIKWWSCKEREGGENRKQGWQKNGAREDEKGDRKSGGGR